MFDILLTDENMILVGLFVGLLMCSGLIVDVITEACRPSDPAKGEDE